MPWSTTATPNLASSGSDRAVPGVWLLARFSAVGLAATTADQACLSDAERAAVAEAAAADAERRAAAEAERRRRAEAAADAEGFESALVLDHTEVSRRSPESAGPRVTVR